MKPYLALLIVLAAAGCAQATDKYPSLALRPIESRSDAEPIAPPSQATPDPALDAQLAATATQLSTLDANFGSVAARAGTAAKAPGAQATGSDHWLAAQSALAEMEGLRGDTLGVVSDLEQLVTARGEAGQPPYPTLDALRARAQDQLDRQVAKLTAIKASLGEK